MSREQVSTALFNLLVSSGDYKYSSRRFQTWDSIAKVQKPALFMVEHKETHARGNTPTPANRSLDIDVYLFIAKGLDPNTTPIIQLNELIDGIDPVSRGVLAPNNPPNRQTLGGLVYDCFIDGEITKVPGDLDGQGVAIIPIKVIFTQAF